MLECSKGRVFFLTLSRLLLCIDHLSLKFFVVLLAADTVCEVFDALLNIIYCPYLQYEFVPIIYVT